MNPAFLLIIPLLTIFALLAVRNPLQVKRISVMAAILQCGLSLLLYFLYSQQQAMGNSGYLFQQEGPLFYSPIRKSATDILQIGYHIGVDGVSVAMILLTSWVVLAGMLVSWKQAYLVKEYFIMLWLLGLGAMGFFISLDLFSMFFFLEIAVIPKYLLIGIWGTGKKEASANKLALMLMAGSALVLAGIIGVYYGPAAVGEGARSFDLLHSTIGDFPVLQQYLFPVLFLGFAIFSALFPFHTWVPDGHSAAPTAGSMFLAGISMKLGGYGCYRMLALMPDAAANYSMIIVALSTIAILYGAFATLQQKDLKYMNAYSSISHCGFVLLGIGMLTQTALKGAVLQMISHGVMTALFFAVIGIVYERTHTRMMNEMGGLLKLMPFTMSALFIAGFCSLGLPGLSGFVAEMTVFAGGWQREEAFYRVATVLSCLSIVVTAVYILRAIGKTAMGPLKTEFSGISDANGYERAAVLLLIIGILAIGLAPDWMIRLIS